MPEWVSVMLVAIGSFGLGACFAIMFLWDYRTMALEQSRWIMAHRDMAAYAGTNAPIKPLPENVDEADSEKASTLYRTVIQRGWVSDSELDELARAGSVKEPVTG